MKPTGSPRAHRCAVVHCRSWGDVWDATGYADPAYVAHCREHRVEQPKQERAPEQSESLFDFGGDREQKLHDMPDEAFARTHARTTDPSTSKAAARSINPKAQLAAYEQVFLSNYPQGLTAEEAAVAAGFGTDGGNYTKRISDLKNRGIVAPTGQTRPGSSGRQQAVLRYVPEMERNSA